MPHTSRGAASARRINGALFRRYLSRALHVVPFVAGLTWLYGGTLLEHVRRAANPLRFADDMRHQTYAFFRYGDPALFSHDYASDYLLRAYFPLGYRGLFTVGARVWDAAALGKVLPYVLLALTCAALWFVASRIGHRASGWFALALVLGSGLFLSRMAGGLPRAFAFPVLAWAMTALVYGRVRGAVGAVWAGAAFYPVAGAIAGMTMTLVLLALPASDRGEAANWTFRKRILVLVVTAGVSVLIMLPAVIGGSTYGRLLTSADQTQFPEAGPRGRLRGQNAPPWDGYPVAASNWASRTVTASKKAWLPQVHKPLFGTHRKPRGAWLLVGLGIVAALGWASLLRRSSAARVFAMLAVASAIGYAAARSLTPYLYLPPRYVMYPIPILCAVGLPVALFEVARLASVRLRQTGAAFVIGLALCSGWLAIATGDTNPSVGMRTEVSALRPLWQVIEALPKDAMIAGWPKGVMDNVPYVTRRQAFLTYETHQVYHERYVQEMRKRMRALIAAYFASSRQPLDKLRDEYGVTHLLFDTQHHQTAPTYFAPFGDLAQGAFRKNEGLFFLRPDAINPAIIYRHGDLILLDLARLP